MQRPDSTTALLPSRHHDDSNSTGAPPSPPASTPRERYVSLIREAKTSWNSLSRGSKLLYSFLLLFYATLGIGFWVAGPERVFDYTARLARSLSRLRYGKPLLLLLVTIASFPPIPGYSTFMSLCGLAFGSSKARSDLYPNGHSVPEGWILAATSSLVGASMSFLVLRFLIMGRVGRGMMTNLREDRNWKAMERAVERKGLTMIIILRFCPFPFVYSNLFFASMPSVSFFQFLFATLLITPKLFLHVFVGSRLFELMDRDSRIHLDPRTKKLNLAYAVGGILIGAITGWVLWRETQKVLKELEEEEISDLERRGGNRADIAQENQGLTPKKVSHKVNRRDRKVSSDGGADTEIDLNLDTARVEARSDQTGERRGKKKDPRCYGSTSVDP